MTRPRRTGRPVAVVTSVVALVAVTAAGAACVDLFHDTAFETRCDRDPASCPSGGGNLVDAAGDAPGDATPDLCGLSSAAAREQAKAVCARLGACLGPLRSTRFGECVVDAQLAYDCTANPVLRPRGERARRWACLATAETCAQVEACTFVGPRQDCAPVPSGLFAACGRASTLVECGSTAKPTGVEPCALSGRTCVSLDPATNAGSCAGTTTTSCTVNGCVGTAAVECASIGGTFVDVGYDCATAGGGRCATTLSGGAACAPGEGAATCSGPDVPTCKGTVAQHCVDGKLVTIDCGALGLGCGPSSRSYGAWDVVSMCHAPIAECTPQDDACEGMNLTSCVRGNPVTVECPALGLGACEKRLNQLAACTSP